MPSASASCHLRATRCQPDGVPMRLIGMLDSPYVRRVAISLTLMDVKFTHEALSGFRNWDAFAAINPGVKGPTAGTDDGAVLMDSALILEYAGRLVPRGAPPPRGAPR